MNTHGRTFVILVFLAALTFGARWATRPVAAQDASSQNAWNMEWVGASLDKGQVDVQSYSKLAPWPDTDGQYLYSG